IHTTWYSVLYTECPDNRFSTIYQYTKISPGIIHPRASPWNSDNVLERIDITDQIFEKAIEIKATNSLSVCDSWIIATAIVTGSVLVHKDPEFEQVKGMVKLKTLPYKSNTEKKS
ncbi:MAG: PIN domain-containing protein, partial [Thermodesulfovibrionales bacterium]|nr:PIN domain-containing protein [Thermodesulfovibrionales bacterium]